MKKDLGNPRFDRHEGEHNILGKSPNCKKCQKRLEKVDRQWMVMPLLGSQYAHTIANNTFHTFTAHSTKNKMSKTQIGGKSTESI